MAYTGLKVRDETEQQAIAVMTRCFEYLESQLNTQAKLEFGRTALWGKDAWHSGLFLQNDNTVLLNFRNLYGFNFDILLQVLCHEMRHAYQQAQGWFDAPADRPSYFRSYRRQMGSPESGWWKGEYISNTDYADLPWEQDAEAHERPYRDQCVQAGAITPAELETHLSGDKTKRPLIDETKALFQKNNPGVLILPAYAETLAQLHSRKAKAKKEATVKMNALNFKLEARADKGKKRMWWIYKGPKAQERSAYQKSRKITINPNPKRKERKDGFCWYKGSWNEYWTVIDKAQKNFVPYRTKTLTLQDLTC